MTWLMRLLAQWAHYYSTHCMHGHHSECKGVCKHCAGRCRCWHHKIATP